MVWLCQQRENCFFADGWSGGQAWPPPLIPRRPPPAARIPVRSRVAEIVAAHMVWTMGAARGHPGKAARQGASAAFSVCGGRPPVLD